MKLIRSFGLCVLLGLIAISAAAENRSNPISQDHVSVIGMGFPTAVDYYYTGWHEPGTELNFMINQTMRLAVHDRYIQTYH